MHVIRVPFDREISEIQAVLRSSTVRILGKCNLDQAGQPERLLLVADSCSALQALNSAGIHAENVVPPIPESEAGILWWKEWRNSIDQEKYLRLREQHHPRTRSVGSIIRIHENDFPKEASENIQPWQVLADSGVDLRCEFHCHLPTGLEVHMLVPDAKKASSALEAAGFTVTDVDYQGPKLEQGISWWGEWKPALDFANKIKRPVLMSFASPRVEQVPGIW